MGDDAMLNSNIWIMVFAYSELSKIKEITVLQLQIYIIFRDSTW